MFRGKDDLKWAINSRCPSATKGHGDMHNITQQVAAVVNSSHVETEIVNVFNIGSTAAIGTIEFAPALQGDMPAILDKLIPPSRNSAPPN